VRELGYSVAPNYELIKSFFVQSLDDIEGSIDSPFEWNVILFSNLQKNKRINVVKNDLNQVFTGFDEANLVRRQRCKSILTLPKKISKKPNS
jgi:hypothetical protein